MTDVRTPSSATQAMQQSWQIIADLMGGTAAMRAAGTQHLPQWPGESGDSYKLRLGTATLFPALARTVDVLSGKPFSRPLTLSEDVPTRIRGWCADVDLQGRDLHAFAASVCESVLSYGLAGILVDHPPATGARTAAQERASGTRPYFVEIAARDLLGWRCERINGAEIITQLRFLERVAEPDGPFGERDIEQVRVLYPGRWEVWRKRETSTVDEWALHDEGVTTLNQIPFVPVYGKRVAFMRAVPPLLELAHLNVEHWQSKSDQQTILHVARVPILFAKGLSGTPIVVGASSAVQVDAEQADLKYVEHSGKAIEAGRLSLLDLEDRMRQIGAELLVIKPANTSVAQTLADNEAGMCALQRVVQDQESALDTALGLMAQWVGEKPAGHVQIYQDFGVSSITAGSMELLRGMNVDGTFSDESLFHEAQRRGIVRPDVTWDAEKSRIAVNTPKPSSRLQD